MDDAQLPRLLRIFDQALSMAPEQRARFLGEQCGDDATLRAEVEGLLLSRGTASGVLDRPPPGGLPLDDEETAALFEAGDEAAVSGLRIGRYRLLRVLGEGGMGRVYEAEQGPPLQRLVALKMMRPGSETVELLARFEAERQTLATLEHPNIAAVYDAGATSEGRPYYVMELVDGVPIDNFCDEHRLTIAQRLELMVSVCRAVEHAHRRGVLHRDLKPSNVLVAERDDGSAVPKIIDFGIAKALAGAGAASLVTREGGLIGTPEYMSPEQASGSLDVDTRTDVYALGVLLYRLIAGVLPIPSERLRGVGPIEVHRILSTGESPPPIERLSTLGAEAEDIAVRRGTTLPWLRRVLMGELRWVVAKALARDREERYGSASELAADVERYLRGEPLQAGPPSAVYRARKLVRRYRVAIAAASAVVLSLAGGLIATSLALRDANRARVEAERQAAIAGAVNRFLNEDILGAGGPQRPADRELSIDEILDRAANKLEQGFEGPDEVKAALHQSLANAYARLGRSQLALEHFERSHELWQGLPPSDR
jgi:hypothetical protein